ncbi:MAG: ABC transporter ATP-binding protein [Dehalococcoidales bacterium]|nr:ABC transporter ATP-binding protein [Dehalococcoidales bacterium]
MAILDADKVSMKFGGLVALDKVSFQVEPGEILGIIGPNGAGKSTLYNVLSGVYRPTSGQIHFQGENITGMKPHKIASKGLVRTYQASDKLFMSLSVSENVQIGCHIPSKTRILGDVFRISSVRRNEHEVRQRADGIVKMAGLTELASELARNLSHGYQRALGVAIGIATGPKILCLDEPLTGMNAEERRHMLGLVKNVRKSGITVLLVEHDMGAVMSICDRIVVINFGRKIAEGNPDQVRNNKDVIEAYLGKG